MNKLILISIITLLIPSLASAYTTHTVTPEIKKGVVTAWYYEFYFTKPPSKEHASVFVEEHACQIPIGKGSGQPIMPRAINCVNSKAEADIAAGKKAGVFEWNCRHSKECDLDKIAARHKKKATP